MPDHSALPDKPEPTSWAQSRPRLPGPMPHGAMPPDPVQYRPMPHAAMPLGPVPPGPMPHAAMPLGPVLPGPMPYGPIEQPPMVAVAVTLLILNGIVFPLLSVVVIYFVVGLYGPTVLGASDGTYAALVVGGLIKAGVGICLAVRVDRGYAAARFAGIGFLLLVTASTSGTIAVVLGPVALLAVVALAGIVPLLDRRTREWCRIGVRPATNGMALLTAIVGVDLLASGVLMVETLDESPAALQVLVGALLVCLAFGLYRGVPGARQAVCAFMLLQPFVDAALYDVAGPGAIFSAVGRLLLAGYVVFVLIRAHRLDPAIG